MKCVSVIGHFGFGKKLLNGQTIKTKIITDELERQLGYDEVLKIDTHGGRISNLIKAPFLTYKALKKAKNVIIFPAHNGLRILVPLLIFWKSFFKNRKLHYVVIGGWLPEFIKNRKRLSKKLKCFDQVYVETKTMKAALEKQDFGNISIMPNCKDLKILEESELVYSDKEPYKLCTFSRVMREKGIEDAINAVRALNEQLGRPVYTLDIYGQIDSNQMEWFNNLKTSFPEYVCYRGVVDYDKSVEVLKRYFSLLFPTFYEGEGFAGTLLDAMAAGIPIIASDWKYNSEIINENNGVIFETRNTESLANAIKTMNSVDQRAIKKKCLKEARKYLPQYTVKCLMDQICGR